MKINNLKLNPQNPRIIKDDKFKKLMQSINDFPEMMEKRPMVCVTDDDGKLYPLGGNMRLKAIIELGYKEIPDNWIMVADDWSEEQRKEFIIKDNVSFGEWNFEELSLNWNVEQLKNWGVESLENNNSIAIEEKEIIPFKKTHILLSFSPETIIEIQEYLQKIKDTVGVEYEQASN
jgi:hypothetical protein